MRYLLDVNALIALGLDDHIFHPRVAGWVKRMAEREAPELATCAITELAFVRILSQAQQYGFTVKQARALLTQLKKTDKIRFEFAADNQGAADLPDWVENPRQITDGHLAELAASNGWTLATLDRGIPSAFVIPL